jgi:DHA2 family multidrug resistance protein
VVSIANFMQGLDTAIANVALSHIAESLGDDTDEAIRVVTTYLIAGAVIIPVSGWLSGVAGRKRYYMGCVAVFTVSSVLCGFAANLSALIFFRILPGLGGGRHGAERTGDSRRHVLAGKARRPSSFMALR